LEFAELQAVRRIPMTMKDWITRLDNFINLTIALTHDMIK
jgi:hypothetical protein